MIRGQIRIVSAVIFLLLAGCNIQSGKSRFILAERLFNDHKYAAALQEFKKVFDNDPKSSLGQQAVPILPAIIVSSAGDNDENVRFAAIEAIRQLHQERQYFEFLKSMIQQEFSNAVEAVGILGPDAESAIPFIVNFIGINVAGHLDSHLNYQYYYQTLNNIIVGVVALGKIKQKSIVAISSIIRVTTLSSIAESANDPRHLENSNRIIAALQSIGSDVVPFLVHDLESSQPEQSEKIRIYFEVFKYFGKAACPAVHAINEIRSSQNFYSSTRIQAQFALESIGHCTRRQRRR